MTLVAVAPSDELCVILCLESDRRAPYDAVAKFKQSPCESAVVCSTHQARSIFYPEPRLTAIREPAIFHATGKETLRPLAIRALFRRRLQHREGSRSDET